MNLSVEDTQRAFIPSDSYLTDYGLYNVESIVKCGFSVNKSIPKFPMTKTVINIGIHISGLETRMHSNIDSIHSPH